jgi:membrane-associated phospholipid phosphatase
MVVMASNADVRGPGDPARTITRAWWPVDTAIVAFTAMVSVLIVCWFATIPGAPWLLAIHIAATAALLRFRSNLAFHCWYPLPYVASFYKEMAILIPVVRGVDYDAWASRVDAALWGSDPTLWMVRHPNAVITEFVQIAYSLFVPAVLVVAYFLWRQRKIEEFRFYAFLIALGFMASYVGYLAVPVRGPRFFLPDLPPLKGLWLTDLLQNTLDRLESAHYDCFPSGHTELTMLACWGSRMVSRRLFYLFLGYTPIIIFATVYLRYHYTIDVLAGAALALVLIWAAPHVYAGFRKRGH